MKVADMAPGRREQYRARRRRYKRSAKGMTAKRAERRRAARRKQNSEREIREQIYRVLNWIKAYSEVHLRPVPTSPKGMAASLPLFPDGSSCALTGVERGQTGE